MLIRTLRQKDHPCIRELASTLFRKEDEIPLLENALLLCVPRLSFVAVENKTIIGFTLVGRTPTNVYFTFLKDLPEGYELAFLGISSACQGRGIGSALLQHTLRAIHMQSPQFTCWLLVDAVNVSAIKMYQKRGFRRWKTTSVAGNEGFIMGLSHRRYPDAQG